MTPDGKLGVGIVGIGWVAGEHIKAFEANPHASGIALCSSSRENAENVRQTHGLGPARVYTGAPAAGSQLRSIDRILRPLWSRKRSVAGPRRAGVRSGSIFICSEMPEGRWKIADGAGRRTA